jgi:hypothetical protein
MLAISIWDTRSKIIAIANKSNSLFHLYFRVGELKEFTIHLSGN